MTNQKIETFEIQLYRCILWIDLIISQTYLDQSFFYRFMRYASFDYHYPQPSLIPSIYIFHPSKLKPFQMFCPIFFYDCFLIAIIFLTQSFALCSSLDLLVILVAKFFFILFVSSSIFPNHSLGHFLLQTCIFSFHFFSQICLYVYLYFK